MKSDLFDNIVGEQIQICEDMLIRKGDEYADNTDRLHNFRAAAGLKGENMLEALSGFMSKHTISIYDMLHSGEKYTNEQWTEKITDHINYLLILKAIVNEVNHTVTFDDLLASTKKEVGEGSVGYEPPSSRFSLRNRKN